MTTEVDNYLEHYGVKGMKWGKRSSSSSSSSSEGQPKSKKELRALDRANRKALRAKERKKWDDDITTARSELDGKAQKLAEATKQYKIDKTTMGKVAAKHILRDHEDDFINTWNKANLATTKEANMQLIGAAGAMVLSAAVVGIASR